MAAALLTFPSLVFEPGRVVHDVNIHLYQPGRHGYDGLDRSGGYVFFLKTLALGTGWPVIVLAAAAIAGAVVRRNRRLLVVASVPVCLYAAMGHQRMYFARFILPTLPALLVLAAAFLDGVVRLLQRTRLARSKAIGLRHSGSQPYFSARRWREIRSGST